MNGWSTSKLPPSSSPESTSSVLVLVPEIMYVCLFMQNFHLCINFTHASLISLVFFNMLSVITFCVLSQLDAQNLFSPSYHQCRQSWSVDRPLMLQEFQYFTDMAYELHYFSHVNTSVNAFLSKVTHLFCCFCLYLIVDRYRVNLLSHFFEYSRSQACLYFSGGGALARGNVHRFTPTLRR